MDPVTAALLIQGGLAGGQALYGLSQQNRAKRSLAQLDDPLDTTPASRLQMLNAAKDQTIANQAVDQINRSLGTSVNALQSGGSRSAGALSGVQRAADAAKTDVLFRQRQQEMNAMAQANQGAERDRYMQAQQFRSDRSALQQARAAGVQNVGNAAIALGSGLAQADYGTKAERQAGQATRQAGRAERKLGRQDKRQLRKDLRDTRINDRAMLNDKSFKSQLDNNPSEDSFNVSEQSESLQERLMPGGNSFDMSEQSESLQEKLMPGNEFTKSLKVDPFNMSEQSEAVKSRLMPSGSFDASEQSEAVKSRLTPRGSFNMGAQSDAMKRKLRPGIAKPKSLNDPGVEIEEEEITTTDIMESPLNRAGKIPLIPANKELRRRRSDRMMQEYEDEQERLAKGTRGRTYFRNKGGKAKKTPGDFSHKSNPLHIVSNNGSKVGEMTGGEYIFNPSQAASLRKHSKGGSTPLHKFVRQMLSKSQFK